MSNGTCKTCKFYNDNERYYELRVCKRYAPQSGSVRSEINWPHTKRTDWCGDYEPVEKGAYQHD